MNKTSISYLTHTWNPVTGCTPVSAGCANCWARRMHARRLWGNQPFSEVTLHPDRLGQPLRVKKPARIGVCFMGDLFHEAVDRRFIDKVLAVIAMAPQHQFLILTKRPKRAAEYLLDWRRENGIALQMADFGVWCKWEWPLPNVWLGVSVEDQATADERIPLLLQAPAAHRWVSIEPMLGPVALSRFFWREISTVERNRIYDATQGHPDAYPLAVEKAWRAGCLDFVVLGGESGPKARPCDLLWIRSIVGQCKAVGCPTYVKQLGSNPVGKEPLLEPIRNLWYYDEQLYHYAGFKGAADDPEQWPEDLRVREIPEARS